MRGDGADRSYGCHHDARKVAVWNVVKTCVLVIFSAEFSLVIVGGYIFFDVSSAGRHHAMSDCVYPGGAIFAGSSAKRQHM